MESGVSVAKLDAEAEDRFVRLGRDLGLSCFGLNKIVLEPRQRLRIHEHADQEEVYIVLEGTLTLLVDEVETPYASGDVVRVGGDVRRQLLNRGPGQLRLIAIGGAGEHERWDATAYTTWGDLEGASPRDIPVPEDLSAGA